MESTQHTRGHTPFSPYDWILYDWGNRGRRIHLLCVVRGSTAYPLEENLELKYLGDLNGTDYTHDWDRGVTVVNSPEAGWSLSLDWTALPGGLVATIGIGLAAWNYEAGKPTGGIQEDIDELAREISLSHSHVTFMMRFRYSAQEAWQVQSLVLDVAPIIASHDAESD